MSKPNSIDASIIAQGKQAMEDYDRVARSGLGTGYPTDQLASALKRFLEAVDPESES